MNELKKELEKQINKKIESLKHDLNLLLDKDIEIGLFSYPGGYPEFESDFQYLEQKDKNLFKDVFKNRIQWVIIGLEKELETLKNSENEA